MKCVLQGISGS